MVQSTDHRDRYHASSHWRLKLTGNRRIPLQRQVGPRALIVCEVVAQNATQVPLAEHDDVVRTVPTDRTDESFQVGILPRRMFGRQDFLNTEALDTALKVDAVDSVVVSQ